MLGSFFGRHAMVMCLLRIYSNRADDASLQLVQTITTCSSIKKHLLIGSYRSNEVGQEHPLRKCIALIKQHNVAVSEIELLHLSLAHVTQMIGDTLKMRPDNCASLAQLVYEKTDGNPFFIKIFLVCENRLFLCLRLICTTSTC